MTKTTPQDFLDDATTIIENLDEIKTAIRDTNNIAYLDQLDASARTANNLYNRVAAQLPTSFGATRSDLTTEGLALYLAMTTALFRVTPPHRRCPHAKRLNKPQVLIASLTAGFITCQACATKYSAKPLTTAARNRIDRCDVCDEPADTFTEIALTGGPVFITGCLCDSCAEFHPHVRAHHNQHTPP